MSFKLQKRRIGRFAFAAFIYIPHLKAEYASANFSSPRARANTSFVRLEHEKHTDHPEKFIYHGFQWYVNYIHTTVFGGMSNLYLPWFSKSFIWVELLIQKPKHHLFARACGMKACFPLQFSISWSFVRLRIDCLWKYPKSVVCNLKLVVCRHFIKIGGM